MGKEKCSDAMCCIVGDDMSCGFDIVYVKKNLELCSCFWMNDFQFAEV